MNVTVCTAMTTSAVDINLCHSCYGKLKLGNPTFELTKSGSYKIQFSPFLLYFDFLCRTSQCLWHFLCAEKSRWYPAWERVWRLLGSRQSRFSRWCTSHRPCSGFELWPAAPARCRDTQKPSSQLLSAPPASECLTSSSLSFSVYLLYTQIYLVLMVQQSWREGKLN